MIVNRAMTSLLPLVVALLLAGCWTAPSANVQPPGPPRLIQKGIVVRAEMRSAVVQSVDPDTRTIVMQVPGYIIPHLFYLHQPPGLIHDPVSHHHEKTNDQ